MSCMPYMTPMSLIAAIAPCTGKIIKNGHHVFKGGEDFLQNGTSHFIIRFSQSSEITLER